MDGTTAGITGLCGLPCIGLKRFLTITDMVPMVIAVMATLVMADIIIQVAMVVTDIQAMVIMVTLHMAAAILVTVVMVIPVGLDGKIQIDLKESEPLLGIWWGLLPATNETAYNSAPGSGSLKLLIFII